MAGSTANTVILAVQALILTPICLKTIGGGLYGAWLASGDCLVWIQALDLGLPNLLIQRIGVADGARDDERVGRYFATGGILLLLIGAACAVVGFGLSWFLPGWLKLSGSEAEILTSCFQFAAISAGVLVANNAVVGLARGLQDTVWMNASVVLSALAGFATTAAFLMSGYGLWSIPSGMAVRAATVVAGSLTFLCFRVRRSIWRNLRLSRAAYLDFKRTSPATTVAGLSYAGMTQCDNFLAGVFLGPAVVPILALTRKAADLIRSVLDPISYSSYAGFAHLVGSDDKNRARSVHDEISSIRLSLSIAAAAVFIAVNQQLVTMWVGPMQFGGLVLTICMGGHLIVVGTSYLFNSLYRATGAIVPGSLALIAESAARIPLIVIGLLTTGLAGPSLAGIITGTISAIVVYRWTQRMLDAAPSREQPIPWGLWLVRAVILLAGIGVALSPGTPSWISVLSRALIVAVVSLPLLLWSDPALAKAASDLRRFLASPLQSPAAA
jgi:O-antigen/teichoic acid export membrane protein